MAPSRVCLRLSAAALLFVVPLTLCTAAEIPFLSGRVNDYAGILSAATVERLSRDLKAHEDSTSNQVVVLTVASLEGDVLEEFSMKVVEQWKLGQKGKDNGVLLLVARDDRKVRIEVGRGLEGNLTDALCGTIIRKEIIPRFKQGDYDGGVTSGVEAVLSALRGSYAASDEDDHGSAALGDIAFRLIAGAMFVVVVGIFTMIGLLTKGGPSWFLYVFLLPFWIAFPVAILGAAGGITAFVLYALGFPAVKTWLTRTDRGKGILKKLADKKIFVAGPSGGWSSGGGSWSSSSGSSFSGGGGSFSGGGSSGSW
jgi:uncharacterized protein